jgi:hypothetical protein
VAVSESADPKLYERVGHLESGVAELSASMKALREGQDRLLQKADRPTDWVGIGGVMLVIFGFLLTLMQFSTGANKSAIDDIRNWQWSLSDRIQEVEKATAVNGKADEWHTTWLSTIEGQLDIERARNALVEQRASKTEGEVERLTTQVNQIDADGSRKWNDKPN